MKLCRLQTLGVFLCWGSITLFTGSLGVAASQAGNQAGNGAKQVANPASTGELAPYIIGPQDVLDISVWKQKDVSRTLPVRPDGKISLPLINDIQAAGLTPMQLADSITKKLEKYITDPEVNVTLVTMNSQRVYVMGEVVHPGPILLIPGMNVLQALADAGGFTQFANEKKVYVLRNEGGKERRYPFNYKSVIKGNLRENITVIPGDTIIVP